MRVAIVTASNDVYFSSLKGLLQSLDGINALGDFSISVLDVGLTDFQCRTLDEGGWKVLKPQWDLDVSRYQGVPQWFKAMIARPFLPNYLKDAEIIVWLDADIWVQDQRVLCDFVRAAQRKELAICLEIHRCYDNIFFRNASKKVYFDTLVSCFNQDVANQLIQLPMMNSGAFAMTPDHRIWSLWQAALREALKKACTNLVEQTALNFAIYSNEIVPHFLPARYNWMACHSIPLLDESTGFFVEPNLPHDRIGMVHLASGFWKRDDLDYKTTTGRLVKGPLRPPNSNWRV